MLEALPLARIPWLVHGFSTSIGGVSCRDGSEPRKSGAERLLNLGHVPWDEPGRVKENRRRFFAAIDAAQMRYIGLRQFHSSMVRIFGDGQSGGRKRTSTIPPAGAAPGPADRAPARGDALATRARGILLTVQTADCSPILLADTRKRVAAAIHAGWRGTAARIAQKTIGDLRLHFGTRPEDVVAAIGPTIKGCCYEVGPDVAHEFGSQFASAAEWFDGPFAALSTGDEPTPFAWLQHDPPGHERPKRVRLDLAAANRWQLEGAGVPAERIFVCGLCTSCQADWLFSYRREGGHTGRLMAAIGKKRG